MLSQSRLLLSIQNFNWVIIIIVWYFENILSSGYPCRALIRIRPRSHLSPVHHLSLKFGKCYCRISVIPKIEIIWWDKGWQRLINKGVTSTFLRLSRQQIYSFDEDYVNSSSICMIEEIESLNNWIFNRKYRVNLVPLYVVWWCIKMEDPFSLRCKTWLVMLSFQKLDAICSVGLRAISPPNSKTSVVIIGIPPRVPHISKLSQLRKS